MPFQMRDPGGLGHDTDEGTDSEHEGTGPFNERKKGKKKRKKKKGNGR